ncbi:MAG: histone deacetylase family protein [Nitratireductor sp.]|nr:histone deacetylase family protein [Nitratireductor sp.]MCC0021175.1 histone deacetylase family protein [Nitratireductor sp.]
MKSRISAFYDPVQARHDPKFFLVRGRPAQSTEQPERAARLMRALERLDIPVLPARDFGAGPRAAVHTPEYLSFLKSAHSEWQDLPGEPSPEVIANIHPLRHPATYPKSIVGRAGWHMADTACPIGEHTFEAACASANTAVTAADMLLNGERQAYALCRPPGHHAFSDMAGGFCFLNNSAIAAQFLRSQHERVVTLDIDVHHGNGTQGIFYRRNDVLAVSIHCDPAHYYPFVWGHACERGEGDGEGYNLNIPLPPDSPDGAFLQALETAKAAISTFAPTALVVALGLDASEHDPLRGLAVTTPGFEKIGRSIASLGLPTVHVQEGGYLSDILTDNLEAYLKGALA